MPASAGDVGELRGHSKADVLGHTGKNRELDFRQLAQSVDYFLDEFCRGRCAGGDADGRSVLDPFRVERR